MQVLLVKSPVQGIEKTKEILYEKVDNKTVLFLSGGKTPQTLYQQLAKERIIKPAAVALIDERFGEPMHENSNEKMIKETGFLDYLEKSHIPFYSILQKFSPHEGDDKTSPPAEGWPKAGEGITVEETAKRYDEVVRTLFFHFPKSIGIMGIGSDGHTSSIIPNRKDFINPMFNKKSAHQFVESIEDAHGSYGTRIGLTFAGLALLDYYLIVSFGKEKAKALKQTFMQGPLEEIPARFFTLGDNAKKSVFVTDQAI